VTPAAAISQVGGAVTYMAGSAPVVLAGSGVVSDTENAFANSTLRVSISALFARIVAPGDQLGIATAGGITLDGAGGVLFNGTLIGSVAGGTSGAPLVMTFNSSATRAGVQAVLEAVTFSNSSTSPLPGTRLATFQFTDGNGGESLGAIEFVNVTQAPPAPVGVFAAASKS